MYDVNVPDLAKDDKWLNNTEFERHSAVCRTPYANLMSNQSDEDTAYRYHLIEGHTFDGSLSGDPTHECNELCVVERFVGIDSCPGRGFCNVMTQRIYHTKTDEWYLRILMYKNKVDIVPYIINLGLWATVGINITQTTSTLVDGSLLCGHFNVVVLFDVVSYDSTCASYQHTLNEWLYVLRICEDTTISLERDEDEMQSVSFFLKQRLQNDGDEVMCVDAALMNDGRTVIVGSLILYSLLIS